jgi:DNA-binding response OmpR family regulator
MMTRVLVIEDDRRTAAEIAAALGDHGFDVECAYNGRDGLLKATAEKYDAIVLDRMLPGDLDGLGVLATLRTIRTETPVLILSALSGVDERVRGLRAGGDDYLTKPFEFVELTARLEVLIRRHAMPQRETTLRVGDLQVDLLTREVRRAADDNLCLANIGCRIPMRHAGRVVTRTMLFEEVWGIMTICRRTPTFIPAATPEARRRRAAPMIHTVRVRAMSSVGLSDIPRTTSFRLALLFLGLFGAASLILFGFMYWQTASYLSNGVDDWLESEMASRSTEHSSERMRQLNTRPMLDPENRRPIALFDAVGHWVAGGAATLPMPLPPMDRPFDFTSSRGDEAAPFRGILHRLASGDILLVARDMREIRQFRDLLLNAMASGALVVLALGMTGAVLTGAGALGRIDGVTRAIERIVNGDLSGRLPTSRKGGDVNGLIQVVNRMLDEIERLMNDVKGVTETSHTTADAAHSPSRRAGAGTPARCNGRGIRRGGR